MYSWIRFNNLYFPEKLSTSFILGCFKGENMTSAVNYLGITNVQSFVYSLHLGENKVIIT